MSCPREPCGSFRLSVHVYVCVCVCVRERERETQKETGFLRDCSL